MSESPHEALFSVTKDNYDGQFNADLLEQYKLYVQSAENISARRLASNAYLMTFNAALIVLYVFQPPIVDPPWLFVLVSVLGILVSLLWHWIIKSHRNLNAVKFEIIFELERKLPVALYTHEWTLADEGRGKRYRAVTNIEAWLPRIFLALHMILHILSVWQFLTTPAPA